MRKGLSRLDFLFNGITCAGLAALLVFWVPWFWLGFSIRSLILPVAIGAAVGFVVGVVYGGDAVDFLRRLWNTGE